MASKQTTADLVASELEEWMERTATAAAGAILDSPFAPQVVDPPPSHAELIAYYTSPRFQALLFNPDGSPNKAGRDSLMAQVGHDGYEAIAKAIADAHHERIDAILAAEPPPGTVEPSAAALLTPIRTPVPHPTFGGLAVDQLGNPADVPALTSPGGQ